MHIYRWLSTFIYIYRFIEETRSTLQFASRAKLVITNALVNEVVDDATKLRRITRELERLKEKQRLGKAGNGISEEESARIEEEKSDLLSRLASLQREKDQQKAQLECLKGLVGGGGSEEAKVFTYTYM
jgi:ABC-type phosphate transport system auxiliary subunit